MRFSHKMIVLIQASIIFLLGAYNLLNFRNGLTWSPPTVPSSSAAPQASRVGLEQRTLPPFAGSSTRANPFNFTLHVGEIGQSISEVRVTAFELGYSSAQLLYSGQDSTNIGIADEFEKGNKLSSMFDAAKQYPDTLLVSAGLSKDNSGTPFGLVLISGTFYSPFNFVKQYGKIKYSGVLCINMNNQIFVYDAIKYQNNPSKISSDCQSAIQAFPILVDNGVPAILSNEMKKKGIVRVVIGIGKNRRRFLLVFHDKISLYKVSQFLTSAGVGQVSVSNMGVVNHDAEEFLANIRETRQAINLPGGDGAVVAMESKAVIGNPLVPLTAVLKINPEMRRGGPKK